MTASRFFPLQRSAARSLARWLVAVATLMGFGLSPAGGAATGASAPSAVERAPSSLGSAASVERLKTLVPTRVGRWKRVSLSGPELGREEPPSPAVNAAFASGKRRIALTLSDAGPNKAAPMTGPPLWRKTDQGHEIAYREKNETVLEKVRNIDRLAQVTLLRDDGLVIVAEGTGVDTARLKTVARAVKSPARSTGPVPATGSTPRPGP
jgi:hypothetical protein